MGKDCSEFICSKDDTSMLEQIYSKGSSGFCAEDFQKQIEITPPKVDSRKDLALWMCDQHNRVNKKLGKPDFPCSYGKLIALYGSRKRKTNEIL